MLTEAQKNIIFTNIATAYTVKLQSYTAFKTWREHWSGEISTPVIMLTLKTQTVREAQSIGHLAEWDHDVLVVDVFAITDSANGVHGSDIAESIMRELETWFKQSAAALVGSEGLSIGTTTQVQDLSFLEEGVYRKFFEVNVLYRLF